MIRRIQNYEDRLISSSELAERTGISYRQLDEWTWNGLIAPLIKSKGSGSRRRWAEYQVGEVLEVKYRHVTACHHHGSSFTAMKPKKGRR